MTKVHDFAAPPTSHMANQFNHFLLLLFLLLLLLLKEGCEKKRKEEGLSRSHLREFPTSFFEGKKKGNCQRQFFSSPAPPPPSSSKRTWRVFFSPPLFIDNKPERVLLHFYTFLSTQSCKISRHFKKKNMGMPLPLGLSLSFFFCLAHNRIFTGMKKKTEERGGLQIFL